MSPTLDELIVDQAWEEHVVREVLMERIRQVGYWGQQDYTDERWAAVLANEFSGTMMAMLGYGEASLDGEIIQVAALCIAWLAARMRRALKEAE